MNASLTLDVENKLPKISLPPSRHSVRSKAESRKTPPFLPPLKTNPADPPQNEQGGLTESDRNDFALQIEEKLKMVMENVNHGEIAEDSEGQSQVEFEELVEQNKEKIKLQKQKLNVKPEN